MNAVEAVDLFRIYATSEGTSVALQGLTLDVAEGELVVVFGPSGSGKSTLLRILAGLDRPSAGTVRVLEHDLRTLRGRARVEYRSRTLGYADQHYTRALAPELTARQLVSLRLGLLGATPAEQERTAATRVPPSCPADSSNASRSARRSRTGRVSSSPTSRPASSTPRTRRRSTRSCASSRARRA